MRSKTMGTAVLLIVGLALLGAITTAWADEATSLFSSSERETYGQAKRFEVEPFIGYHYFEDKQNLKDRFTFGGRLTYNFSNRFGVEGTMAAVDTRVDDATRVGAFSGQYRFPTKDVDLRVLGLNAIYQFSPERRFTPFVTLGFSKLRYQPEVLGNNTNTLDYGLGAKYWMQRDVALRADFRDQTDKTYHNYSGTFGVVFAFGGRSKRRAAPAARVEPVPEEKEVIMVAEESPLVEEKVRSLGPDPKTVILVFEDVHFQFDQSTLTEAAKVILRRNIQILKDHPSIKVRVAGYTSASGSDEYNQRLSERRAASVERYLVDEGVVSQDRITTIGFGEDKPAEYEVAPKQLYSKAAMANMRVLFETVVR